MSKEQHTTDLADGLPHVQGKGADGSGGACLNRHVPGTPKKTVGNACSHRWQSYLATQKRHDDYDWPKYESLSTRKRAVPTAFLKPTGFPRWYTPTIPVPAQGDWDVTGDNFYTKCTIPYWHEAHHAIPNSVLRVAIDDVGKDANAPEELIRTVRRGLLTEKYNLNHHSNMITLPLDPKVSAAIRLPIHRRTARHREHGQYSNYVMRLIKPIFNSLRECIVEHKQPPDFAESKELLEFTSGDLIEQIRTYMGQGRIPGAIDRYFN